MSTAATTSPIHELAVATDTTLAELHSQRHGIQERLNSAAGTIKQYAGAERNRWGLYNMTLAQAEATIAAEGWKPAGPVASWGRTGGTVDQARAKVAQARTELAAIDTEIAKLDEVWEANGRWARFFIVQGGHIHSSMSCPTCNRGHEPTTFGWLPELSGLSEADAVAAHGALLCTVCFPSAPVEWTNGLEAAKQANRCAGSGEYVKVDSWQQRYVRCPACGTMQSRTNAGLVRAHKPPTEKKKAPARKAKPAPAAPAVDEAWEAMQSPALDAALRAFHAAEAALDPGVTEGPEFEATKAAFQAMRALSPEGWSSYRRAKDLGLHTR